MLRAILNKSWRQHPTRHQLYGHQPPITKTIQVRRTRHAGHCWRSGDELISDILLWTPTHGRAKAGRPARTCILQLCEGLGTCILQLCEGLGYPCYQYDMTMMIYIYCLLYLDIVFAYGERAFADLCLNSIDTDSSVFGYYMFLAFVIMRLGRSFLM